MRSVAPRLVQRTTWPLTVGRNKLCDPKIRRHAKRGWMKNAHHHHTLPRYCCGGWMLLCTLFYSVKLYSLVDITSRRLFLFWNLDFRTWTDKQTPPCLLLYIWYFRCLSVRSSSLGGGKGG
jgi:hypothetical protein